MNELLLDTAERAARYLDGAKTRDVNPDTAALTRLAQLPSSLPEEPTDAKTVLAQLDEFGSPATVVSNGGRYFGFVTGGALPAALAANWLASAWDQNSALSVMSPVSASLERRALDWMLELLGLQKTAGGAFVTGATMANFSGLAAARHALLQRVGWDVEANGLFDAPPITVVVGDEVHVSVLKALSMLGFGRERVVRVPADKEGRMRVDLMPDLGPTTIVCAQAGNVNSGAFDDVGTICANARGAWIHVDGAFGLWANASPSYRHLCKGVDKADSWATDAHKWLNVPYDNGFVACRDPAHLYGAMSPAAAAYLPGATAREAIDYTPDMSRRARGVDVWAALSSLGKLGVQRLIDRCCTHATTFKTAMQEAGFDVLNDVELNQVLVSFGSDRVTDDVVRAVQREGVCWCGSTVWQGRTAMRISVSSFATTAEDVERSVAAIRAAARAAQVDR